MNEVLLQRIQERSRRLAYSFSESSGIEVADLLQEIGLQVVRKWERIQAVKVPETYAMTVARNRLIDLYRAQKKTQKRGPCAREVSLFQPLCPGSDQALIDVLEG